MTDSIWKLGWKRVTTPTRFVSLTVRIANLIAVALPLAGLVAAIIALWGWGFHWSDTRRHSVSRDEDVEVVSNVSNPAAKKICSDGWHSRRV